MNILDSINSSRPAESIHSPIYSLPKNINELCSETFEIDMSHKQVDIPRHNLKMRNITKKDYQRLTEEQLQDIKKIFQEIFTTVKYNNFSKLSQIIQNKKHHPETSLRDIFQHENFSNLDPRNGTNCLGFSTILKEELTKKGIQSYIIGFQSTHAYLEIGHTGLLIPFLNQENEEDFLVLDLNNSESLGFKKDCIPSGNTKYPFSIKIPTSRGMEDDFFNPYLEFLNPYETMNKDVLRVRNKHSIVKTGSNNKIISFNIAMKTEKLIFTDTQVQPIYKKELSFKEFLELKNDENRYNEFRIFMEEL